MKRSIILIAIFGALLSSPAWAWGVMGMAGGSAAPAGEEHLDVEQDTGNDNQSLITEFANEGQSFQVTHAGTITAIGLYIGQYNGASTLRIRVGADDDLTSSYTEGTVSVGATGWAKVTFASPLEASTGTTYYFGAKADTNDMLKGTYVTPSAYSSGQMFRAANAGENWHLANGNDAVDFRFRIYVTY